MSRLIATASKAALRQRLELVEGESGTDIKLLAEAIAEEFLPARSSARAWVDDECTDELGRVHKKLSAGTRKLSLSHTWTGTVPELQMTLWCPAAGLEGATIAGRATHEALLPRTRPKDRVCKRIFLPLVIAWIYLN